METTNTAVLFHKGNSVLRKVDTFVTLLLALADAYVPSLVSSLKQVCGDTHSDIHAMVSGGVPITCMSRFAYTVDISGVERFKASPKWYYDYPETRAYHRAKEQEVMLVISKYGVTIREYRFIDIECIRFEVLPEKGIIQLYVDEYDGDYSGHREPEAILAGTWIE